MIQFGLRLHDAEKLPVEQVLPLVRQKGFTCAHVALSKSFKELPCTPSALTPGYALYLRHLICHINYLLLFIVLFMIKKESYVLDPLYNKCTDLR